MSDPLPSTPCSVPQEDKKPKFAFGLLGPLSIRVDDAPYRKSIAGPARELFIYLLTHQNRRHRREALPEIIWGELRAPSRGSFNTTLWRLKKFLVALDGPRLVCDPEMLRLQMPANCHVDSVGLSRAIADLSDCPDILPPPLRKTLEALTAARRGSFAEGEPSDWLLEERERMHDAFVRAVMALMRDASARASFECALEYCQRILSLDPFRERIHCEMLWLMVLTGQRARAIQRHRVFCARLRTELNIGPMAETTALFDVILKDLEQPQHGKTGAGGYAEILQRSQKAHAKAYASLRDGLRAET